MGGLGWPWRQAPTVSIIYAAGGHGQSSIAATHCPLLSFPDSWAYTRVCTLLCRYARPPSPLLPPSPLFSPSFFD